MGLWIFFNKSIGTFQFVNKFFWIPILNLNFTIGVDGISLFFILLTTLLIPICLLASWDSIQINLKIFLISFLVMEFFLIGVFCILDVLIFYIFFESVLIPMYLMIGIYGSRERKIRAGYFFFLYTLLGSVLMLLSILYIYHQVGSTDYEVLLTFSFSALEQRLMWFSFFASFATKVPMVPVHLWLRYVCRWDHLYVFYGDSTNRFQKNYCLHFCCSYEFSYGRSFQFQCNRFRGRYFTKFESWFCRKRFISVNRSCL